MPRRGTSRLLQSKDRTNSGCASFSPLSGHVYVAVAANRGDVRANFRTCAGFSRVTGWSVCRDLRKLELLDAIVDLVAIESEKFRSARLVPARALECLKH